MANAKQKKGFTKKILGGSELTMEEYAAYITALKAKPLLMRAEDADFVVMTDTIRSRRIHRETFEKYLVSHGIH